MVRSGNVIRDFAFCFTRMRGAWIKINSHRSLLGCDVCSEVVRYQSCETKTTTWNL